jgi:8-oxo-dGTP diphosphatase
MTVYLVRHAKAGDRGDWGGSDDLRPLSKPGRRQAAALAEALRDAPIERIVSSPSVRCRQTVEPLAELRRLPVELADELAEGAPARDAMRVLEKVASAPTVLCSHGDVIAGVLRHLASRGVPLGDDRLEKASVWALDVVEHDVVAAHYSPPPL